MSRFQTAGITFHPKPGDVLACDFAGYVEPEIVKVRPVVIVSADTPGGARLAIVVPLSTVRPAIRRPVHLRIPAGRYAFGPVDEHGEPQDLWAKGDLLAHVSFERLDRLRVGGRFARFRLTANDLIAVQGCVLHALGLGRLAPRV